MALLAQVASFPGEYPLSLNATEPDMQVPDLGAASDASSGLVKVESAEGQNRSAKRNRAYPQQYQDVVDRDAVENLVLPHRPVKERGVPTRPNPPYNWSQRADDIEA